MATENPTTIKEGAAMAACGIKVSFLLNFASGAERDAFEAKAAARGMTVPDFVAYCVTEHLGQDGDAKPDGRAPPAPGAGEAE